MIKYIIRRLIGLIPLLLGITVITFAVIHLAPGSPTDLEEQFNPKVSLEVRQRIAHLYGLDKPLHVQYTDWLGRLLRLDFGISFVDSRPVIEKIGERIPITLGINLASIILILLIGIPIGVSSAVKEGAFYDRFMTVFVFIGFAMPTFWLSLILMDLIGVRWGLLPISGIKSLEFDKFSFFEKIIDIARHLTLPIFVSAFGGLAGISRYMRSNMVHVLKQDYIRTARAKGLKEKDVIYKHALKNALLPVVTILGLSIPGLIGGSVIFESIFSIPGMGRLFYESVMARDYPVIMGGLVITAILTLLGNLLADVSYAAVDPRIKLE
ncbi:MAG: ABC transporter permease [Candidatus Omnitrophica bacterium]|nr:ABC transporter permease [Candidatus Omnitrophota bacterium]MBU1852559.1 ABC transporter permease [Candidatus Omnitrophota bacterium]